MPMLPADYLLFLNNPALQSQAEEPSEPPTEEPSEIPTEEPSEIPTEEPSEIPTEEPSEIPTEEPSEIPTEEPSEIPTEEPSEIPTEEPFATETDTLLAAMSVEPDATRKERINDLVVALKTAGVWSKIDLLYVKAAHNSQAAALNWKNPAGSLTLTGAPPFTTDRGFTSNDASNQWMDTAIDLSSGFNWSQNSAHIGIWLLNDAQNNNFSAAQGSVPTNPTPGGSRIRPRTTVNTMTVEINQTGAASQISGASASSRGYFVGNRSASNATQAYRNGASVASGSPASAAVTTSSARIGKGPVTQAEVNYQFAIGHFGGSLTAGEVAAAYSAFLTYLEAVGAM